METNMVIFYPISEPFVPYTAPFREPNVQKNLKNFTWLQTYWHKKNLLLICFRYQLHDSLKFRQNLCVTELRSCEKLKIEFVPLFKKIKHGKWIASRLCPVFLDHVSIYLPFSGSCWKSIKIWDRMLMYQCDGIKNWKALAVFNVWFTLMHLKHVKNEIPSYFVRKFKIINKKKKLIILPYLNSTFCYFPGYFATIYTQLELN